MRQYSWTQKTAKISESHKYIFNLPQILDFKSSSKHTALQNWSIYYTWNNKKKCNNDKLKIIASTWNDEFELPDSSYSTSDIQD